MKLVSRSEWKARPPKYINEGTLNARSTGHWNGPTITIGGKTTWDHSKCAGLVRGIQNFHMDGRGWADIAYNFVICPHGWTFVGRGIDVCNGANGTNMGNKTSHAIMWLSGEKNPFDEAERVGFKNCVNYIADHTAAPPIAIGHRDHKATECPGDERYRWIKLGMYTAGTTVVEKPTSKDEDYVFFKFGDTGRGVEFLNGMLNIVAKFRIPASGHGIGAKVQNEGNPTRFGTITREAVREFQRFLGVMWELSGGHGPKPKVSGEVDRQTHGGFLFWIPIAIKNS